MGIVATGEFYEAVGGKTEYYRVEPYNCIKCGRLVEHEFVGTYGGKEAAESALKLALSKPCFSCDWESAKEKAKELR